LFPSFYTETKHSKVTDFLRKQFREEDPFEPLRKNFNYENQFVRACHEKFDGLRILQYLKSRQKEEPAKDEFCLYNFIKRFYTEEIQGLGIKDGTFSFDEMSLEKLEKIRMFLVRKEEEYQVSSTLS
jgi:hypothetical protein